MTIHHVKASRALSAQVDKMNPENWLMRYSIKKNGVKALHFLQSELLCAHIKMLSAKRMIIARCFNPPVLKMNTHLQESAHPDQMAYRRVQYA